MTSSRCICAIHPYPVLLLFLFLFLVVIIILGLNIRIGGVWAKLHALGATRLAGWLTVVGKFWPTMTTRIGRRGAG
jgi:hypothetical protein